MALCAVCGTGLREGATHCTTCGAPSAVAPPPPPPPVVSPPSPFESDANWSDPAEFGTQQGWAGAAASAPSPGRPPRIASARSPAFKAVIAAVVVVVIAALLAVVALPRLFPSVDPQKFVGTWAYAGASADRVVVARQGSSFSIVFVGRNGARQSLPGMISAGKLEIDYDALGPRGAIVKKLAESIGAHLSFTYRKSDDRLVLTGANPQGSFTLVLKRSSPV